MMAQIMKGKNSFQHFRAHFLFASNGILQIPYPFLPNLLQKISKSGNPKDRRRE